MASTIRWLHLSDFHVGKDAYEQNRLFGEIIKEVGRWRDEKKFVLDYVFITGDIANRGLKKEYETFRESFLIPLQEKLNSEAVVFPVPGNHDVERPSTDTFAREAPLASSSRFFDASKEGKIARDQALPRFKNYKKLMATSGISPDWLAMNDGSALNIREVAGVKVGVVGLNTAWLCKDDYDKDKLTPGYRLVDAALKKIEYCQIKIVLGHHPLSWWHDSEEEKIRSLFAEHHVIYLHGHKHKAEGRFEEGGVDQFLVLQAGAAFQAREGDKWVNGFSWGELDPVSAEIRISPWRLVNREWRPDVDSITMKRRIDATDWWGFPVPGMQAQSISGMKQLGALEGWLALDADKLREYVRTIEPADAKIFFDGAEPDWSLAMSPHFPVREQAAAILKRVAQFKGIDRPQIALVRGPTAEGKSMALRQIVSSALEVNPSLQVLWHQDESLGIDIQAFQRLLSTDQNWLIATDHGDMIIKDLVVLAQNLKRAGQGNVQFVLAAHDSDWKIAKGDTVPWNSFSRFEEARLSGLSKADATLLATAWQHFGASACDESWHNLTPELLAEQLLQAAKEDEGNEGALFGALLTLRHGRDLRAHVRTLMQKFDGMSLSVGGTVGDVFCLIAAMHAENLEFLSSKVLQEVIGCDRPTLQRDVLGPMTAEAAASGGAYLRTRHRRIAKALLEICIEDDMSLDALYLSLVEGAVRLGRVKGEWLEELAQWEYLLPKHFLDTGRTELAMQIATKILQVVPGNSHYAVNLARMKRESGDASGAIRVLESVAPPKNNRAFWREWGTACGMREDFLSNAALHAYSISDDLSAKPPTIEDSKLALAGLAKAFAELHTIMERPELCRARASCAWLGLLTDANDKILKDHQNACTEIGDPKDVAEATSWLSVGLSVSLGNGNLADFLIDKLGEHDQFKFGGLQRLLEKKLKSGN